MDETMLGKVVKLIVTMSEQVLGILCDLLEKLGGPNGSHWANELKKFLRKEPCWLNEQAQQAQAVTASKPSRFSVGATTQLNNIVGKKTKRCFVDSRWAYRDSDLDSSLPIQQPNAPACTISTLAPTKSWTFVEGAAAILGIGASTDSVLLGTALIENGYTMTLVQAEEMVKKTERHEKTKMRVDGYGNFFFVETGDEENPVSVGCVFRDERVWRAYVFRLGHGSRWHADIRLLLRNLNDTSHL